MSFSKIINQVCAICIVALLILPASTFAAEDPADALSQELSIQLLQLLLEEQVAQNQIISNQNFNSCRNTQITSYSPSGGAVLEEFDEFIFYTTSDIVIESLEATINGDSYPVQYRQLEDGTYRAKVVVEGVEGNVYLSMGVGSSASGACNSLLETSFTVGSPHYTTHSNQGSVATIDLASTTHQTTDNNTELFSSVDDSSSSSSVANQEIDEDLELDSASNSWISWLTGSDDDEAASELATESTSTEVVVETEIENQLVDDTQSAQLLGAIDSSEKNPCSSFGSSWPWYVYLGIIWLWLVVLWWAIGFYAEPLIGTDAYARRMNYLAVIAALIGIGIWYLINQCMTHLWLPITFVALAFIVHWLYSEDKQ